MTTPWGAAADLPEPPVDEWAPDTVLPTPPPPGEEERPDVYGSVYEWVEKWLAHTYRRSVETQHRGWCPQWWMHQEAVVRLDALWRAWEQLYPREEDSGAATTSRSDWWVFHADHTMDRLLDPQGPFQGCSEKGHIDRGALAPLPVIPFPYPETPAAGQAAG